MTKSRYDSSISQRSQNVDLLLQERNTLLENDLEHYKKRILDKDIEIQGYLDQIRDLKDNIENLGNTISKQDLYAEQFNVLKARFDRLTLSHIDLVHKANQTKLDRDELEVEIEKISKQLQETKTELDNVKKNRLDPKELEEARNHVRELVQELKQREDTLKEKANDLREIKNEANTLRNHIQQQKNDYEKEMLAQKEHYEDKLKRKDREIRNKMRNYVRPGEIKSIEILMNKVDKAERELEYDDAIKEMRAARDKFRTISEDPNTPSSKRWMYDRRVKEMNYRIDEYNLAHNRPVETPVGGDILSRQKEGIMGAFYKIKRLIQDNYGGLMFLASIGGLIFSVLADFLKGAASTVYETVKTVAPSIMNAVPELGKLIYSTGMELARNLLWLSESLIALCAIGLVFLVSMSRSYSKRKSNSSETTILLSIWSFIIAVGIFYMNKE